MLLSSWSCVERKKRRKMFQCLTIKYIHKFKNKTQPIKATFLKQAVQNSDVESRVVWKNITCEKLKTEHGRNVLSTFLVWQVI